MAHDDIRGLLGLSLRAGKLALGDEPVHELIHAGHARAVFLASDAGAGIDKKIRRIAAVRDIPVLVIPCDKSMLGAALGRASCAVCATSDIGFAASAAEKLAPLSAFHAQAAEKLQLKNERIKARKGRRKQGAGSKQTTEYIDIEEEEYERLSHKSQGGK